jgi:hypothetical protein
LASRLRPVVYSFCFVLDKNERELLDHGFHLVGVSRRAGYGQMARFLRSLGPRHVLLADAAVHAAPPSLNRELHGAMAAHGLQATFFPGTLPADRNYIERGRRTGAVRCRCRRLERASHGPARSRL